MRTPRLYTTVLIAFAAITLTGACGSARTPSPAGAAGHATTSIATSASATPTPSATIKLGQTDPRAGTDPAVYAAKPTVMLDTDGQTNLTPLQQRTVVAFVNDLVHRAIIDFSKMPTKRTPEMWTRDMTEAAHAVFVAQVKAGVATFGDAWAPDWSNHMRATGLSEYSITVRRDYLNRTMQNATMVSTRIVRDFDEFAGAPHTVKDAKTREMITLTTSVVSDGLGGWKLSDWQYEGGSSTWQYLNSQGDWVNYS